MVPGTRAGAWGEAVARRALHDLRRPGPGLGWPRPCSVRTRPQQDAHPRAWPPLKRTQRASRGRSDHFAPWPPLPRARVGERSGAMNPRRTGALRAPGRATGALVSRGPVGSVRPTRAQLFTALGRA